MIAKLNDGLEQLRYAANARGGDCLSSVYKGVDYKYHFRCSNLHEWDATFDCVVRRGHWCAICSGRKVNPKERLKEAQKYALSRGGKCLSVAYKSSKQDMQWRCGKGHEWVATWSNISRGKWCPWCSGNKVDGTVQYKKALYVAHTHGGKCLSDCYVGNKSKMRWQCVKGHEWEAIYTSVVSRGAWCPRCNGTNVNPDEQLQKAQVLAIHKGGICLTEQYVDNRSKMQWQCARGHIWDAPYYSVVQAGSWCPICSTGLKERLARYTFEKLFGLPFSKHRPAWLVNSETGRLMELDGYNPALGLAFEYQGPQHYRVVLPFKMEASDLAEGQRRDLLKRTLCHEHNVHLVVIPCEVEVSEMAEWIYQAIADCSDTQHLLSKMTDWRDISNVEWIETDSYNIDNLRNYAQLLGGKCLSETYLGVKAKHRWVCEQQHVWDATWDSINNQSSWCPVCCGNIVDATEKLTLAHNVAARRGGVCLSTNYISGKNKLDWRCSKGHAWSTRLSHVLEGSWCPVCARQNLMGLAS